MRDKIYRPRAAAGGRGDPAMKPGDTFCVGGQWYLVEEADHFKRYGVIAVDLRKLSGDDAQRSADILYWKRRLGL